MDAWDAMKRWASSPSDISSENSATALFDVSAAFSAKLAISADLRLDLVRRAQEPPQHRVVAHDARVLAHVAHRGDRAGQELHRGRAAHRVEVSRLLEVLDQRERVHGLAHRVQVEHRLIDARVA